MNNAPPWTRRGAASSQDGKAGCPSSKPLPAETQSLLRAYAAARERCEVNRQLAEWIIDLQARLGQALDDFENHDCRLSRPGLEAEVERLRLCIMLAARARKGDER